MSKIDYFSSSISSEPCCPAPSDTFLVYSLAKHSMVWFWIGSRCCLTCIFWPLLSLRAKWLQYWFLQRDTECTLLKSTEQLHSDLQHWPSSAWCYEKTCTLTLKFQDIWPVQRRQCLLGYSHTASVRVTAARPDQRIEAFSEVEFFVCFSAKHKRAI